MELAGLSRDPDPTLVRHIYDLHMMRAHLDMASVAVLVRDIATADAAGFRNQYPAYADDISGETFKAPHRPCAPRPLRSLRSRHGLWGETGIRRGDDNGHRTGGSQRDDERRVMAQSSEALLAGDRTGSRYDTSPEPGIYPQDFLFQVVYSGHMALLEC
jgi:hypothetical protein